MLYVLPSCLSFILPVFAVFSFCKFNYLQRKGHCLFFVVSFLTLFLSPPPPPPFFFSFFFSFSFFFLFLFFFFFSFFLFSFSFFFLSFFFFFFFLCCCYYCCCCWSPYLPICANLLRFHLGARVSLFLSVPAYSVGRSVPVSGYVPTFLPVTNYFRIYLRDRISTYLSACAKILPYLSRCPYTFLPVEKLLPYLSRCPYYLPIYIGVRISTYLSACDNLPPYLSRSPYIYLPFCL